MSEQQNTGGLGGPVPRRPYDLAVSKGIIQKHIEAGEIEQADIDILNDSYRLITRASFLGSTACGVGTYFLLKRRAPNMSLGSRLVFAGGLGMVGSFAGFTIGGVGAAMEVKNKMHDAERKLQVFAEIAAESQEAMNERMIAMRQQRTGVPGQSQLPQPGSPQIPRTFPTRPTQSSSSPQSSTTETPEASWDVESARERREEEDRERTLQRQTASNGEPDAPRQGGRQGQGQAGTVWDKLRAGTPINNSQPSGPTFGVNPKPATASSGVPGMGEDTRSKEQREFDELLEKERQGLAADETWK